MANGITYLDTSKYSIIGAMICCDWDFPESARSLILNGAEVTLIPNACEIAANSSF